MPATWYKAVVEEIVSVNESVRIFYLRPPSDFQGYRAGQFITLDLPVSDKRLHRWKSYSIANAPSVSPLIELCIVRHPDGIGTRYLFEEVSVGSELTFKGPEGSFVLPPGLDNVNLIMVCTGTGIAPFRAMIQEVLHKGIDFKKIHLIFGGRTESDILYREELEKLASSIPGFFYDVCLSRSPLWRGYKGYVHQVYQEKYAVADASNLFYLCGWSNMIDEAVNHLITEMGYDKKQVRYELYG